MGSQSVSALSGDDHRRLSFVFGARRSTPRAATHDVSRTVVGDKVETVRVIVVVVLVAGEVVVFDIIIGVRWSLEVKVGALELLNKGRC